MNRINNVLPQRATHFPFGGGAVNAHYAEVFERGLFSDPRWYARVWGQNPNGEDCLECGYPHFNDECPSYPLAEDRIRLFYNQGRCLCCKGYHPTEVVCTRPRDEKTFCRRAECREAGFAPHDRLFCTLSKKNKARKLGRQMPAGWDPARGPRR